MPSVGGEPREVVEFLNYAAGEGVLERADLVGSCGVCARAGKCLGPKGKNCAEWVGAEERIQEVMGGNIQARNIR